MTAGSPSGPRRVTAPPGVEALLDPHRRWLGWQPHARDRHAGLQEAEVEFERTRDPLVALAGARLALEHGLPVPRAIAQWLLSGLSFQPVRPRDPKSPRRSFEQATGLKLPGKANPRVREAGYHALRAALGRMFGMQMLYGATIGQAAALVASLSPDFKHSTLEDRYRRGGYTARLEEYRAEWGDALPIVGSVEDELAKYPDRPLAVAQAKAAIRAMYAKRRP